MATRSVSICKGRGSMAHNNREFITPNVDPDRVKLDVTYANEPLSDAYERLFNAAIKQYNDKQKRSDRKIDDYMEKIRTSKNGEKLFYETVVQVGNKYSCATLSEDGDRAAKILDEYMKGFQSRNPNLYVFNAVLHLDEATPHLHIDWIPIARGYQRGLQIRNSLDKALCQQGCEPVIDKETGKKDFQNATFKWQHKESEALVAVMERYGWEKEPDTGLHRENLSVNQYKAVVRDVENRVENLPDLIERKPAPFSKDKVVVSVEDLDALEVRAKLSIVHEEATKAIEDKMIDKQEIHDHFLDDQAMRIMLDRAAAEKAADQARQQRNQAEIDSAAAETYKNKAQEMYNEQRDLNDTVTQLRAENEALKARIDELGADHCDRVEMAVKQITEPLTAKIEALQAENKKLKQYGRSLLDKLNTAMGVIKEICQAIGMLKYDREGYRAKLTAKQDRLVDAVARYGAQKAQETGYKETSEEILKSVGISEGIQQEIRELYREQTRDDGPEL